MTTNTMVAIQSQTVTGSPVSSITFNSIPQTYTDLILVAQIIGGGVATPAFRVGNGSLDTATNYSTTILTSSGPGSYRESSKSFCSCPGIVSGIGSGAISTLRIHFQNYSNTSTYKSFLIDGGSTTETGANAGTWRSTSAINTISMIDYAAGSNTYPVGSTFTLYGIANADIGAYATGGIITQDSTYYYHAFGSSGTFTPSRALTADILVVAGGGGGGMGGGGAGGVLAFAAQSLSSGTGYTCTVGNGGAAGSHPSTSGSNGGNSQFASLTASVGGGGGGKGDTGGGSGGSGGGSGGSGSAIQSGGSPTSGQGYAGGNNGVTSSNYPGGGGGGAGGAGTNGTDGTHAGNGGAGVNTVTNWGALANLFQATGYGYNGYIAGGGGGAFGNAGISGEVAGTAGSGGAGAGSTSSTGNAALANTGSGGGANSGGGTAGAGGSGLIIVRYAK